jgi:hypothetical protein
VTASDAAAIKSDGSAKHQAARSLWAVPPKLI